jgi:hypothetical protein
MVLYNVGCRAISTYRTGCLSRCLRALKQQSAVRVKTNHEIREMSSAISRVARRD